MKQYIFNRHCLIALLCITMAACSKSSGSAPIDEPVDPPEPPEPPKTEVVMPGLDKAVAAFMTEYEIPGMSIAISKNSRLVYKKGYGKADVQANTPVTDSSLFRIASISKPITSVAIMTLLEQGKISLSDKVFGEGAILGTLYGSKPYNDSIKAITIKHLLNHTAGGWLNDGGDPMFKNKNMTAPELLGWTLDNDPQENYPGEKQAYSNFGFFVLGRVIEKISGMGYEEYVRKHVLEPCGIKAMRVGGNTLADRAPNEVRYYAPAANGAYVHNISRLDAAGGWIASAEDLVRFLTKVDGFQAIPDILAANTLVIMTTRNGMGGNYACGWVVNDANNWFHNGGLPGTNTLMVRTASGYNWALLCNGKNDKESFGNALDQLIWKVINDPTTVWPSQDLFKQ
jgi:Beta-lactamase class C and other penicillin binding proteins